jgi:hypothetical protein
MSESKLRSEKSALMQEHLEAQGGGQGVKGGGGESPPPAPPMEEAQPQPDAQAQDGGGREAPPPEPPREETPAGSEEAQGQVTPPEAQPQDEGGGESPPQGPEEWELLEEDGPRPGENGDGPAPQFNDQDKEEFRKSREEGHKGERRYDEFLRDCRNRKWYRMLTAGDGSPLYPSYDAYIEAEEGLSRQDVTVRTNWLRSVEALERLNMPVRLSRHAARALVPWKVRKAGGLRAIFNEAQQDGLSFSEAHLREIVDRRSRYGTMQATEKGQFAAATYEQYRADLRAVEALGQVEVDRCLLDHAKAQDGLLQDAIVALAGARLRMPDKDELLREFTGERLNELVARLAVVASTVRDTKSKLAEYETLNAQLKAMQNTADIQAIREKRNRLRQELVQSGLLPRKDKKDDKSNQDDNKPPEQQERLLTVPWSLLADFRLPAMTQAEVDDLMQGAMDGTLPVRFGDLNQPGFQVTITTRDGTQFASQKTDLHLTSDWDCQVAGDADQEEQDAEEGQD